MHLGWREWNATAGTFTLQRCPESRCLAEWCIRPACPAVATCSWLSTVKCLLGCNKGWLCSKISKVRCTTLHASLPSLENKAPDQSSKVCSPSCHAAPLRCTLVGKTKQDRDVAPRTFSCTAQKRLTHMTRHLGTCLSQQERRSRVVGTLGRTSQHAVYTCECSSDMSSYGVGSLDGRHECPTHPTHNVRGGPSGLWAG